MYVPNQETGESKPSNPKSLEHTERLRNLLEISRLLTAYEGPAATLPAVLNMFAQTLPLKTAIAALGPSGTFSWNIHELPKHALADAVRQAHASYDQLAGEKRPEQDSKYAKSGEGAIGLDGSTITLPLIIAGEPLGVLQVNGGPFDQDDENYLRAAANQIALAVRRFEKTQSVQAESNTKLASAHAVIEQKELARATAEIAKQLGENVLSSVSHDLKNPLTAIQASLDLLSHSQKLGSTEHRIVETANRAVLAMKRLIEDLLDWASIDAGHISMQKGTTSVAKVVSELAVIMKPLADQRSITLYVPLPEADLSVFCDPDRTQQILVNLVGNAIKFTPAGGRVAVETRSLDGFVQFAILDTGPGISEEVQAHVFERFWTSKATKGTGLGLAISRGLVEAQGGKIWVESKPGRGSAFKFTLPTSG